MSAQGSPALLGCVREVTQQGERRRRPCRRGRAGVAVQPFREVSWTDPAGTIAYGAAAVAVVALPLPRRVALLPGTTGTGLACAVEILQLTGIPAALAERFPPIALLLGSSFDAVDLMLLVAGAALATVLLSVPPRTVGP